MFDDRNTFLLADNNVNNKSFKILLKAEFFVLQESVFRCLKIILFKKMKKSIIIEKTVNGGLFNEVCINSSR